MKNIKIILLAIIISSTYANAQFVTVNRDIILFDSLSINELKEKGLIADKVIHANQILFLEFTADGIKNQYYKSSDSTYYFRSFYEGKSYEEGQFSLANTNHGQIDTFFTFCIPEEMILERKYLLLKSGKWIKTTPGGEKFFGSYLKGKKEGTWTKVNFKNVKSKIEYSNDTIVNLTKPYSHEAKRFLSEYRNLELIAQFDNTIELANKLIIDTKQSSTDSPHSYKIILRDDNQIELSNKIKEAKPIEIIGSYHYFTSTFTFEIEQSKIRYKISEIGKNKIVLERQNQ